jgi:hypothetical protein
VNCLEIKLQKTRTELSEMPDIKRDVSYTKKISSVVSELFLKDLQRHLVHSRLLKTHEQCISSYVSELRSGSGVGLSFNNELLILHLNKEKLKVYSSEIREWFSKLGIIVNTDEDGIKQSSEGFTYLGFQIIEIKSLNSARTKVKVYPSQASQRQLLSKIRKIIQSNKSTSSYELIKLITPVILCWGNYFKYFHYKPIFQKLTHLVFQKLRAWVFRRDTKNGRQRIKEKYFPSHKTYVFDGVMHQSNWVLVGRKKDSDNRLQEVYLPHLSWIRNTAAKNIPITDYF